jgi:hypothetical protein
MIDTDHGQHRTGRVGLIFPVLSAERHELEFQRAQVCLALQKASQDEDERAIFRTAENQCRPAMWMPRLGTEK